MRDGWGGETEQGEETKGNAKKGEVGLNFVNNLERYEKKTAHMEGKREAKQKRKDKKGKHDQRSEALSLVEDQTSPILGY